jgi:hypothetical protein
LLNVSQLSDRAIRQAVLSKWAVDEAYDTAFRTLEAQHSSYYDAQARVSALSQQYFLFMALAVTAGTVIGMFFLLIGDWTAKSGTELLGPPYDKLIPDFSASPKDVYETVEKAIAARQIPDSSGDLLPNRYNEDVSRSW